VATAAVLPAQAPPVFESAVEAVYLDVFVTRRNAPVTGLRASDFQVRDNGVVQRASLVALDAVTVTAVLVLDSSESVRGRALDELKAASRSFVRALGPRDKAALVTFSHDVVLAADATTDREALGRAIDRLRGQGATALFDALYAALRRPWPDRPLVVVFTDGADTMSWLSARDVLEAARASNAVVYLVGSTKPPQLDEVAEVTGGRFVALDKERDVEAALIGILEAMRTRYLLTYEPSGVARAGRHRLEVRVKGGGEVRHRREYVVAGARAVR
jgi:VWFA-related protein